MPDTSLRSRQADHRAELPAKRIIVVEDDDAARESCVALLEAMGYHVLSFASCEEMLDDAPDTTGTCLLLDYHFTGMMGFDCLDALAAGGVILPTVLYTGRLDAALRKRAKDYGNIVEIVEKPLGGRHLTDALAKAFDASSQISD